MTKKLEFENDRVKVTRVKLGAREAPAAADRRDRLVIYLEDGRVVRGEAGAKETIQRKLGEVVWRERSTHEIANAGDEGLEVLIVEFK